MQGSLETGRCMSYWALQSIRLLNQTHMYRDFKDVGNQEVQTKQREVKEIPSMPCFQSFFLISDKCFLV